MGLIKAALGAAGGVMADQWKEYFYCESIPVDVLVCKGQKRTTGRGSNTKGSPNVISNGSVVAVADGQCMCIVENGKVVDVCAVPGEFIYDTSIAPSIFTGDLGENIKNTFSQIGKRFAFGGEAGRISGSITSTPRRSSATNMAPPAPFLSGWWTSVPASI